MTLILVKVKYLCASLISIVLHVYLCPVETNENPSAELCMDCDQLLIIPKLHWHTDKENGRQIPKDHNSLLKSRIIHIDHPDNGVPKVKTRI